MAATGFHTADELNDLLPGTLPGLLGIVVDTPRAGPADRAPRRPARAARAQRLPARRHRGRARRHQLRAAPRARCCPRASSGFTTIELKSNYLGTAREGRIDVVATNVHAGRTTQVWDAVVTNAGTGKTIALFRCTQSVLWPR